MGLVLWIAPVIAVILSRIINNTKQLHMISVCASFLMLLAAGFVTKSVILYDTLTYNKFFLSAFYIDSVSIIILDITIIIGFLVSIYSIGYLDEEVKHEKTTNKKIKFYYSMMYVFIFSMVLALTVNNIGIMWVAIEATTLA
ncbi:MAG: hydrogenase 4 subunit F, partial [Eubacteriales bacterium]|nr:hydrogenase 4 subunit F [Eubacteriales bacterium]